MIEILNHKVLSFNIIMVLPLLISSCVSIQKYPSEWSPLISAENEKCINISGTYENEGETTDKRKIFLSGGFWGKHVGVTDVQITQSDDDKMEILFWDNGNLVHKKIYLREKNEYTCTSEGIKISLAPQATTDFGEGLMPVSVGWGTIYLKKNTNGELVVRVTSIGMGLILFIPVAGSGADYVRFKQSEIKPEGSPITKITELLKTYGQIHNLSPVNNPHMTILKMYSRMRSRTTYIIIKDSLKEELWWGIDAPYNVYNLGIRIIQKSGTIHAAYLIRFNTTNIFQIEESTPISVESSEQNASLFLSDWRRATDKVFIPVN